MSTSTATPNAPNVAPAGDLLRRFYQGVYAAADGVDGKVLVYQANGDGTPRATAFYDPADVDGMARWSEEHAGLGNVYFLSDLIRPEAVAGIRHRRGRGKEHELAAVMALRADVDGAKEGTKKNYPPRARILEALDAMPLRPSAIIGSGSAGVHPYWFLHEPCEIDSPDTLGHLKGVSKAWQGLLRRKLGTDPDGRAYDMDSTADLTRVLRPAGSIHYKRQQLVDFVEWHPELRYSIEDFEEYIFDALEAEKPEEREPAELPPVFDRGTAVEQARARLARLPGAIDGQGGHNRTFHAACILVLGYALTVQEAWPLLVEWNARCDPPWTDVELRHKLEDADKRGGPRGYYIVTGTRAVTISNADLERDEDGKEHVVPLPMGEVLRSIRDITGDWPRRVGSALFIHDDDAGVCWLDRPPALFGWLATLGQVYWRRSTGCVTKEEAFAELQRTATGYEAIEHLPHEPRIEGHYYACRFPKPADGSTVQRLLDYFAPDTDLDRQLMLAAWATPRWGGPPGSRPAFMFTCLKGRGKGKSKAAQFTARLHGGSIDVSPNEDVGVIKPRLLSPDAGGLPVATLDNVKTTRFSWGELEGLITSDTISGKRMYVGNASRPNYLTWLITLNGASLSTDMAQRVVEIRLAEPTYQDDWEERVKRFIDENHGALIADLLGLLRRPAKPMRRHSRWATWETGVLARVDDPDACLDLILDRRGAVDVEKEEGGIIEDYFGSRLAGLEYDPDTADVFIPNDTAARWFNEATGERRKTTGVTRALKQMRDEDRLWRIMPARESGTGARGFRWIGEHADAAADTANDLKRRIARKLENSEGGQTW